MFPIIGFGQNVNLNVEKKVEFTEKKDVKRIWVHTCTLDHDNALKNYLARGMKIYKKETIKV